MSVLALVLCLTYSEMDFKAALQAEIEAKKRKLSKISSSESSSSSKSVKVADLERQRQEEYLEKQRIIEEQRQVRSFYMAWCSVLLTIICLR